MPSWGPAEIGVAMQDFTLHMLSFVGDHADALAVLGAALIARSSFNSWRKQRLAEKRMEQAERILNAAHGARLALKMIRMPSRTHPEIKEANSVLNELNYEIRQFERDYGQENSDTETFAQVHLNRLNSQSSRVQALQDCLPLAHAIFGEGVKDAVSTICDQFKKIENTAPRIALHPHVSEGEWLREGDGLNEAWKVLQAQDGADEIDKTVDDQIAIIEDACIPVLRIKA